MIRNFGTICILAPISNVILTSIEINLNCMANSWNTLTNRLLQNYSHIAYAKDRLRCLNYVLFLSQFLQLSVLKFAEFEQSLNPQLSALGNWAQSYLINPVSVVGMNLLAFAIIAAFVVAVGLKQRLAEESKQDPRKLQQKYQKLKIIVYLYTFLEFIYLPCFALNSQFYYNYSELIHPSLPQLLCLALSVFNSIFILSSSLIYSDGMLLGKWTFLIVLFSLQFGAIDIAMKIVSILALLTLSLKKSPFERILIRLLLFIFVMDFLALTASVTISSMHFVIFNVLIVFSEFLRPNEGLLNEADSQNEILMEILQRLNQSEKIQKRQEIILLTIVFRNREKIEQFANYFTSKTCKNPKEVFQNVNVHKFGWLSTFFKLKLETNIKQSPQNLSFKLQQTIFCLKYQKINMGILKNLMSLKQQTLVSKSFKQLKLFTQIEMLFNEIDSKERESSNPEEFLVFSQKIEHFNQLILECCQGMIEFFTRLKSHQLNQQNLLSILGKVCSNQRKFKRHIKQIQIYKGTSTELRLFDYAMKLLNVDYEPKMLRKGEVQFGNYSLVNSHYIYLSEDQVTEVSNRVLVELKRKREQIVGESWDSFVPPQLKYYLGCRFQQAFETVKNPPIFVFPFLQSNSFLLPYKIKVSIQSDLNSGIKYLIHFFRSQQLQQSPTFLYSLHNDSIVNSCPLFHEYIRMHNRSLEKNTICVNFFGADLGYLIADCKKTQIKCFLKPQKRWQKNLPLNLAVLQTYSFKNVSYALIQVITSQIQQQKSQVKFRTLETLVTKDMYQAQQLEKHSRSSTKTQSYYCRIKHPCEDMVYVKMSQLNSNYRKSYIKWILLFLILLCILLTAGMITIGLQVVSDRMNYQKIHDLFLKNQLQVQQIYSLFYQYYQYYQIFNFPIQILAIQKYNLSALYKQYSKKSNDNVVSLSTAFSNNFILTNHTYTLSYDHYNKTLTTGSLSMLQFLTDIKQSLISNNPAFSVRNAAVIEKIVGAFQNVTLQPLYNSIDYIQQIILGINCTIFAIIIIIKIFEVKLQLTYREVFKIYTQIDEAQIDRSLQKFQQLLFLGKNSITYKFQGKNWKDWKTFDQSKRQGEPAEIKNHSQKFQNKSQLHTQEKIKSSPKSIILIKRVFLILIPVACYAYFLLFGLNLQTYKTNAQMVLNKTNHLQGSILFLLKKAQNYFELSMQQILPESQRQKVQYQTNINLYTSFFSELPPYFNDFMKTEKQIISYNLCNYSYLNTGSLYKGINCSLILNGAMDSSLSSTIIMLQALVQKHKGTYISQLGQSFANNAKYPVFMELCYTRRTLNNIFNYLQTLFNQQVDGFIQVENNALLGNLFKGLLLLLFIIGLAAYTVKKLSHQAQAIIKCIKILPKKALLNFKAFKFMTKYNILEKALLIPF